MTESKMTHEEYWQSAPSSNEFANNENVAHPRSTEQASFYISFSPTSVAQLEQKLSHHTFYPVQMNYPPIRTASLRYLTTFALFFDQLRLNWLANQPNHHP